MADDLKGVTDGNAESMLTDALYDAAMAAQNANNLSAAAEYRRMASDNGFVGALAAQNDGKKADFPKGYNLDLLKTPEYTNAAAGINSSLDRVDAELASPGTMSKTAFDQKAADMKKIDMDDPATRAAGKRKMKTMEERVKEQAIIDAGETVTLEDNSSVSKIEDAARSISGDPDRLNNFRNFVNLAPEAKAGNNQYIGKTGAGTVGFRYDGKDDGNVETRSISAKDSSGRFRDVDYSFSPEEITSISRALQTAGMDMTAPQNRPEHSLQSIQETMQVSGTKLETVADDGKKLSTGSSEVSTQAAKTSGRTQ